VSSDVPAYESGCSGNEHGPAVRLRFRQIAWFLAHRGVVRGRVGSGCQR
jgi:hypothetical protein